MFSNVFLEQRKPNLNLILLVIKLETVKVNILLIRIK